MGSPRGDAHEAGAARERRQFDRRGRGAAFCATCSTCAAVWPSGTPWDLCQHGCRRRCAAFSSVGALNACSCRQRCLGPSAQYSCQRWQRCDGSGHKGGCCRARGRSGGGDRAPCGMATRGMPAVFVSARRRSNGRSHGRHRGFRVSAAGCRRRHLRGGRRRRHWCLWHRGVAPGAVGGGYRIAAAWGTGLELGRC